MSMSIPALYVAYSCGPNIIIGAGGIAYNGVQAAVERTNVIYKKIKMCCATKDEKKQLDKEIQELHNSEDQHSENMSFWARSMVPVVGLFWAMYEDSTS